MPQRKYRIAILVEGLDVPVWVREFADWASEQPAIELAAIIIAPRSRDALDRLLETEERFLCRKAEYSRYVRRERIAGCAAIFDRDEEAAIRTLQLDAIVNCGRVDSGGFLDASRDGIVSLCADPFDDVLEGRIKTGFALELLRPDGSRHELFSGSVATALLYSWNVIALHTRAYPYLRSAIEKLANGTAAGPAKPAKSATPVRTTTLVAYGLKSARRSFHKAMRQVLGKEFNWQVAFARQPWSGLDFGSATLVPNPPNAFLADPFSISVGGSDYLFVEEFPFDTRKGVISAYRLVGDRAERIGVVLEEPWHLSFPFVFEHGGEVYMVPESGAGRSVNLYKAVSFPTKWIQVKTLLADVPAVDTTIFQQDSRWWMLTTIQGEGPGLNNAELHAFHADDPLGEWTPHALNPIVMDAGKGRNGGFVRDQEGRPCRVAQVPGFTFYGAGSAVYRIDRLTPDAYAETLVREVRADFLPKLDGTHHVHCTEALTCFDFMRVERPGTGLIGRMKRIFKRRVDAPRGFEPRLTESESVVLPLDDGAAWEPAR